MKHPFKVGDTVYHIRKGKQEVVNTDNGSTYSVCLPAGIGWCKPDEISFSPWPQPDWERPKPPFAPTLKKGDRVQARLRTDPDKSYSFSVGEETESVVRSALGTTYSKENYQFFRIEHIPVEFK